MVLQHDDLWGSQANVVLFTGNATLNRHGELVMGRGAAQQARGMFPGLGKMLGARLEAWRVEHGTATPYGVLMVPHPHDPHGWLGVFQVKWHYIMDADLDLIQTSTNNLYDLALSRPDATFAVNFPGIGAGRRAQDRGKILEMLERLPDNVEVHEYTGKDYGAQIPSDL